MTFFRGCLGDGAWSEYGVEPGPLHLPLSHPTVPSPACALRDLVVSLPGLASSGPPFGIVMTFCSSLLLCLISSTNCELFENSTYLINLVFVLIVQSSSSSISFPKYFFFLTVILSQGTCSDLPIFSLEISLMTNVVCGEMSRVESGWELRFCLAHQCCLLAVWPWMSQTTPLCLSFFICSMGIVQVYLVHMGALHDLAMAALLLLLFSYLRTSGLQGGRGSNQWWCFGLEKLIKKMFL